MRASPSSTSPRASHSSSTSHRLGFPDEYAGSSDRAGPSISFGAPADDGISIMIPPYAGCGSVAFPPTWGTLSQCILPAEWNSSAVISA